MDKSQSERTDKEEDITISRQILIQILTGRYKQKMNYLKCKQSIIFIVVILICFGFSFLIKAGESSGQQKDEILVLASSRILEENMAKARKEALREAMFKGIENYLVSRLGKERVTNNFIVLAQEIIPQASEYVENYHILSQERIGDTYKIFLSLGINEALMEKKLNELDILAPERTQIKILFLVTEVDTINNKERYWWKAPDDGFDLTPIELALFRFFQDSGFYPINRSIGLTDETYDADMKAPSLNMFQVIKWGRLYSADVVVQGRFELASDKSVVVDIRAMNVHQDELIAQLNYIQLPNESPAESETQLNTIEQAAKAAAQKLGPMIIRSTAKPKTVMNRIKIHLSGLKSLKQQKIFLDFFKTHVKGVQSIIPVRIKKQSISYSVQYLGDTDSLIKALSGDSGFPFEAAIQGRGENEISIVIL